ncbi:hypothetical protein FSP39_010677 [Pinctada imbricata]|uniref:Inactive hydroxysteroid dehydrogenase-like protein 1 n=1 Tax=Pinctada imbricata TaxID=66713 RepID=A0AA89C787_PINIB|nr:hypothetical protein FSP39_010677 [Pinctada imbricata]
MAAVDRFGFLFKEISDYFSNIRDILAFIGVLYASKKTLHYSYEVLKAVNDHVLSKLSFIGDLRRRYGSWAVITGSSEGIGKAYARELARRKVNVVLISRGENRLYKTAREIEEEFGVETCTVPVDFNLGPDVYSIIWNAIKDKEIGILVNNVGVMYDFPQQFLDVPQERLWQLINVNVAAATMMTYMVMPQMVERRKGAIVMMSSRACTQITPHMTIYAATKSFLDYFARSLQYEYKNTGVVVQSLKPFYVATRMTRYSKTLSKPSLLIPTADDYASSAIKTLGYSSRTSGYWPHTIQSWFSESIPEWLWMWGATRLNNALRRQAEERLRLKSIARELSEQSLDSESS